LALWFIKEAHASKEAQGKKLNAVDRTRKMWYCLRQPRPQTALALAYGTGWSSKASQMFSELEDRA